MKRFLEPFVDTQHDFLTYLKSTLPQETFNRRTESYVLSLKIEPEFLLNQGNLLRSYKAQMEPLEILALNQGFNRYP